MKSIVLAGLTFSALLMSGCVTKQTHELVLEELNQTRNSLNRAQNTIGEQNQVIDKQHLQIQEQLQLIDKQHNQINEQLQLIDKQQTKIEEQLEKIKSNQEEITRENNEITLLENKKTSLNQELERFQANLRAAHNDLKTSKSQIEALRQIEAETQKRNAIYSRFVEQLQKMIDGGQLTVNIEKGRIVINLPENILYATGSAFINPKGRETLKQIALLLREFNDRRFQIEGHTDNVPIQTSRFPSNWELSTARALSVVHLMNEEGVPSENLSAAGFGEFHPKADNATKEGRKLNRRIEIIMLPNLDILSNELPKVIQ